MQKPTTTLQASNRKMYKGRYITVNLPVVRCSVVYSRKITVDGVQSLCQSRKGKSRIPHTSTSN